MFNRQLFAKSILTLVGLTAGSFINAVPPAPDPASLDPAMGTSKQDPTAMHCAVTQYIQWIRAQTKPPDPDVKARKLQEIDDSCGSSLHLAHVQSGYEAALSNAAAAKQSGTSNVGAPNAAAPAASVVPTAPPAVQSTYKCIAQDGSTVYGDTPCGTDAKPEQAVLAPPTPAPSTPKSPSPETIAAARDKAARESSALTCSTQAFNEWIKSQGHPLPDPNVRIAKLTEISNQCRRPLGLPDMVPPVPIAGPKPVLQGPAGDAAATNLAELVKSGSIERLQRYLALPGVDISDRPGTDEALLDYAAEQNQAQVARFLIEHGAQVNAVQTQARNAGYTALHRAAIADSADVAELLLAHGAEVNVHGPLGITPLILAASNGSRRTAEVLLTHGADISVPTGDRETALSDATAHGHLDIVRLLLIHLPTPTTNSMNAVAMRGDLEALRLMLRHDELVHDVSASTKDQAIRFTILGPDQFEERKQMIELLLADGADIDNAQGGIQVIPVMLATTPEMVEFLFAHGANKKANLTGAQLAQWFVCNNTGKDPMGMLQVVIAHGIDIGGTTPQASSALPCAARANDPALLPFLAQHQVGVNRANDSIPSVAPRPNRACVRFDQVDNSHTPIELYASVADCAQNNRDADAIGLFILAGMDTSFDSLRVADKTAGQARQILIMSLFEGMPANVSARFKTATKDLMDQPQRRAVLCEQINKIGPPQYFPAYMVNHGLGTMVSALSKQAPPTPLEPNFDAASTWANLLTNYLNCSIAVTSGASHATEKHTKGKTKEIISSVLTTADETQLVVMTSRFHYIFTIPATLLAAIKGPFHPYVQATFSEFHVDMPGATSGTVSLSVSSAPDEAVASAIAAGFAKTPDGAVFVTTLHGFRYYAGDVHATAKYKLNKPYEIEVEDDLQNYKKPSPIMTAAGYLTVYGILLVVAPQVFTSR